MMIVQVPLLGELLDSLHLVKAFFLTLYTAALGFMVYAAIADPGQVRREEDQDPVHARLRPSSRGASGGEETPKEQPMPRRAHKSWLYSRPIRRYDHYCRWLTNCIGLLNHREFFLMCTCLVAIGCCGIFVDLVLVVSTARQGKRWVTAFFLMMHLTYSIILSFLAYPIWRLHVGFVMRNELAHEWKRNDFYVVPDKRRGGFVSVNTLSDDEFNEMFDAFQYEKSLNRYDKDTCVNCWSFWCTPRWAADQQGDF